MNHLRFELRWWWLLLLFAAAAVVTALIYHIAAYAYDASAEHVLRAVVYSQAVSDGVLLPRWTQHLHWGLGSPLFTFQGPLPYALLDGLFRLGIPHPIGWRLLMAAGLLAAMVGAFMLTLELTGRRWPAFLAAVAFLYAPYVLRNALERGSNEAYSMFLYPWVLWSLLWLARRPRPGRFLLATALWSLAILGHVLAPLLLAPFAALLAVLLAWRYRTAAPLLALLAGVLLTALVWAPMAVEQAFVHVERNFGTPEGNPVTGALPLDRLLAPPAIYDSARDANQTGVRMGLLHAALLALGLPGAWIAWRRGRRELAVTLALAAGAGLFLTWMLTSASDPLWRALEPLLYRVQYRTRLMGLQALFMAVTAGLLLCLVPTRRQMPATLALGSVLAASALPALYVELQLRYVDFGDRVSLAEVRAAEIVTGGRALTAFGEFEPRWSTLAYDDALLAELGPDFDPQQRPLADGSPTVQVRSAAVSSDAWNLELTASQPQTITLHLLYYPRWQATLDGAPTTLRPQEGSGLAQVALPAGEHRLALRYGSTPVEQGGLLVSGLTALGLLALAAGTLWRRGGGARSETGPSDENVEETGPSGGNVEETGLSGGNVGARSETGPSRLETGAGGEGGGEPAPPLWLLMGLSALLLFKFAYVDPQTTWLRCTSTAQRVCGAAATTFAPLQGGPVLRGYTVSDYEPARGDELRVAVYWQGVAEPLPRLHSFLHVRNLSPDDPLNPRTGDGIWAQQENYAPGGRVTDQYQPGKLYVDEFRVRLPDDMPPGEYFLEIGLFDPASGEQLDPVAAEVEPPLGILWRSLLLPNVTVQ